MEFRQQLQATLSKLMEQDEKIIILDADLSKPNGTAPLYKKYPNRCFNVGISEQNMVSVAAGLAAYGFKPLVVTFTPFATRRVCDQIAISVAYAKNNVKILGTDPGITAELNGGTHMSMEDVGVVRSIPGVAIYDAVDYHQLEQALPQIMNYDGPLYIRMPRKLYPEVFAEDYKYELFKSDVVKEGTDVSIIATGIMVKPALDAAEILAKEGVSAEVISVNTIKPLDEETILTSVKKTNKVITCENHNVVGGLFSAVCELMCREYPIKVTPIGVQDEFGQVGKYKDLAAYYKMTAEDIVKAAK